MRPPTSTPVSRHTFLQHWKPKNPRAGNLAHVNRCMTRREALTRRHVQINSPGLHNVLVLDLDRDDGMGIMDAFDMVGRGVLPAFNWATESKSGGAHIAYVLAAGVAWTERARLAPREYFEDVRWALTQAAGADTGYRNFMTYNPVHPNADTRWLRESPWTLKELHQALRPDGDPLMPNEWKSEGTTSEGYGESRHQTLFDDLRQYAYQRWATHYQDADSKGLGRLTHLADITAEAHRLNDLNFPTLPLPAGEVESTARTVARWTWKHFHDDSKSARRREYVMRTQHVQTRAARIAELRELAEDGQDITAAFIQDRYGIAETTAVSYLKQLGLTKREKLAPLDQQVRELIEDGKSIAETVRATGATRDQVRYSMKRQGLKAATSTKRPRPML